ncbi:molybdate ABC transporter substrate-binding protein [Bacillus sp. DJP31]|uniref:molybdate ABC transporter substrate-binding protein n=1 Tax=Bacillus sp. DJP31 TaxID=3409789 RepID=UPI003BB5B690
MKYLFLLFILVSFTGCGMQSDIESKEITISAAASLKDALEEIRDEFTKEYPTIQVSFNFGSSGSLQQQIVQGAPIDLFLSASKEKFELLKQQDLIMKDKSVDILQNSLVLIEKKNANNHVLSFQDIKNNNIQSIAIGLPETVPAGQYAKETFQSIGIWKQIEPKLIYGKDVRQVLSYLETENVELGIVYLTDALTSPKVTVLSTADEKWHSPINYSIGVINNTSHLEETEIFYHFLQRKQVIVIFEKYGFKGLEK